MTIQDHIDLLADGSRGSTASDRRAQVQRDLEEKAEERRRALASQSSPLNDPAERIRIWERLHALSLPRARDHSLVAVVARQTDLTVQQVRDEQDRRAGHS
jgi:hypothetical protein